jgi:hypothetical protein
MLHRMCYILCYIECKKIMQLYDYQLPENCTYHGKSELNVSNILIKDSKRTAVSVLPSICPLSY